MGSLMQINELPSCKCEPYSQQGCSTILWYQLNLDGDPTTQFDQNSKLSSILFFFNQARLCF